MNADGPGWVFLVVEQHGRTNKPLVSVLDADDNVIGQLAGCTGVTTTISAEGGPPKVDVHMLGSSVDVVTS